MVTTLPRQATRVRVCVCGVCGVLRPESESHLYTYTSESDTESTESSSFFEEERKTRY